MAGILYGVGVGPGDPELITVKAVNKIKECRIIGIPARSADSCTAFQIAKKAIPELAGKEKSEELLCVEIPMTKDEVVLVQAYEKGASAIAKVLRSDENVAFLNLGDPMIFGSYIRLHKRVVELGFDAEIISGVPSFCAVAAELGIALGEQNETIHIVPGSCGADAVENGMGINPLFSDYIAKKDSVVCMKSGKRMDVVRQELVDLEARGLAEVSAVTNCGMEQEKKMFRAADLQADAGYFTTILVKAK